MGESNKRNVLFIAETNEMISLGFSWFSTADVFPDVATLLRKNNARGREVTTRNTSAVRGYQPGSQLLQIRVSQNLVRLGGRPIMGGRTGEKWSKLCNRGGGV